LRVGVALYAMTQAGQALGLAIAAAYLVFAGGVFWVAAEERERLEIAALGADALVALSAAGAGNHFLFLWAFGFLVAHVVIVTIHKRRLERVAYQINRKAVYYRAEAETSRTAERERLAADFHDGPMQLFMGFQVRMEVIRQLLDRDPAAAAAEIAEFQETLKHQAAEMREFMLRARDGYSSTQGRDLGRACEELGRIFERDTGIPVRVTASGELGEIPEALSLEVLQIVREAMHNSFKHSNASQVDVTVSGDGASLHIEASDNGKGFPFRGAYKLDELDLMKIGPHTIKRRVRDLNGSLMVESRPGEGSRLVIRIPR